MLSYPLWDGILFLQHLFMIKEMSKSTCYVKPIWTYINSSNLRRGQVEDEERLNYIDTEFKIAQDKLLHFWFSLEIYGAYKWKKQTK